VTFTGEIKIGAGGWGRCLGGWVVVCSLGGESWDGEEEGEIEGERVGRVWIYWLLPMESPMDTSCWYTCR
jgi:hypothetical protein